MFWYINRGCLCIAKNVRLSWSGLWVLIMLLYSDVVRTSVSILHCPMLTGYDGKKSMVNSTCAYNCKSKISSKCCFV